MSELRHRERRKAQRQRARPAALNLVSLMDIFTLLVFFLMVNASDVETLPPTPGIRLPDSSAEQRPEEQLVISVSRQSIAVEGESVALIADLDAQPDGVIDALQTALRARVPTADPVPEEGLQVTIVGDHELPYWLLKRIMLTCQTAEFPRISLAVNQTGGAEA
jgi:biopolymer transport protein ExbD